MPTEFKILAGVLALVVSHDAGRRFANRKLKKLLHQAIDLNVNLWTENREFHSELSYLIDLCNKRGINLDEFDLIALPHIHVEK